MDKTKGKETNLIIESVDKALKKYSCYNVDVVKNELTGMIDVIYHSNNNSFPIHANVSDFDCLSDTDKKILVRELNNRHVGYCW